MDELPLYIAVGCAIALLLTYAPPAKATDIHYLPFSAIQKKCESQIAWEHIKRAAEAKPKLRLIANGCYISSTDEVYVRNDLSKSETQRVLKHELKHRDGWRH
jgi:hypothetical protein